MAQVVRRVRPRVPESGPGGVVVEVSGARITVARGSLLAVRSAPEREEPL